jgi:peptidoglycan/xylan/chitin deacetylase (PgdA/CDA1 family)
MNTLTRTGPAYQPSRTLDAKIRRRLVQYRQPRKAKLRLDRPVVSITFDDVPKSAFVNALPLMEARGWLSTLYIATGLLDSDTHMGRICARDDVYTAFEAGHEVAAHSHLHRDYAQMEHTAMVADNRRSLQIFDQMDIPKPRAFAWPYGEATRDGKAEMSRQYQTLRGIRGVTHRGSVDLNQLGSYALFSNEISKVEAALAALEKKPGWLTLFTHDVCDTPSDWGCTTAEFAAVLDKIEASGAQVLPVTTCVERYCDV